MYALWIRADRAVVTDDTPELVSAIIGPPSDDPDTIRHPPRFQILGVAFRVGDVDSLMVSRRLSGRRDQVLAAARRIAQRTAEVAVPKHGGIGWARKRCNRQYRVLDWWGKERIA